MSMSNRRRDLSPSRGGAVSSKLRMDRQPITARITDPASSLGKRKEIDNLMKKARANHTTDYWDKKLLEVEEKDPNRWRHTGYKKMYIGGESSSDSEPDTFRMNNHTRSSRSRSRNRKTPPLSPARTGKRSPTNIQFAGIRRRSPPSPIMQQRRRSPRSPDTLRRPRSPIDQMRRRPRSPPEPNRIETMRRKSPRSPRSPMVDSRRIRTPPSPSAGNSRRRISPATLAMKQQRSAVAILPRSKRPPSPPPKDARTPSNSSVSSCSDDSCSVCSPKIRRARSRSVSNPRVRHIPPGGGPRSPPPKMSHNRAPPPMSSGQHISHHLKSRPPPPHHVSLPAGMPMGRSQRPLSPEHMRSMEDKHRMGVSKHRVDDKVIHLSDKHIAPRGERVGPRQMIDDLSDSSVRIGPSRSGRPHNDIVPEDPRLKVRPPEPPVEPTPPVVQKKPKEKSIEKLRAKVKIEGEKRKKNDTSDSDDSSSSENSLPTFTATTRLTLSERFGKMAQWSVDRSNMENMRITKDSTGGALKVMIEEGREEPPRRFSYSPAPAGHFPEELATTAPTGLMSWDDVRVRYDYYKSRGYLRDLDLKDYIKWEEWWYRYQEWLKQERYYEFYERQQMHRRNRRKKIPITQRLN